MELRGQFTVSSMGFPNNNPKGYTRVTQKSRWTDKAKEYEEWKSMVAYDFLDQCGDLRVPLKQKMRLSMKIYYNNNRKSDPSNVFKGIEDALADAVVRGVLEQRLYKDDNFNEFDVTFDYDKEDPRVEVKIYF